MIGPDFFQRDPVTCARDLVGTTLVWNGCEGVVVETEAYAEHGDEACHTFSRPSSRRFVANHPPGTAYVYLNYGMYWMTNVLVKSGRDNGFVLIRALEPTVGLERMKQRRNRNKPTDLCSGPGKLSMALGVTGEHHGESLVSSAERGFRLGPDTKNRPRPIADVRVGISSAQHLPWRFLLPDSPHVSIKPSGRRPAR